MARLLKQQSSITVCHLPTKERKFPLSVCSKQTEVYRYRFPFIENKRKFVESLQSHCIHIQFHWSSGPLVCFPSWGTGVQSPGGYLCDARILLLVLSRYIGDPNVNDHCGLVWGGLRPKPSLGCRADNMIIPLDLKQLFCPGLILLPASQPHSWLLGGTPVESLHSHCIHTQFHWSSGPLVSFPSWGTWVQPQGGTYVKPGISC